MCLRKKIIGSSFCREKASPSLASLAERLGCVTKGPRKDLWMGMLKGKDLGGPRRGVGFGPIPSVFTSGDPRYEPPWSRGLLGSPDLATVRGRGCGSEWWPWRCHLRASCRNCHSSQRRSLPGTPRLHLGGPGDGAGGTQRGPRPPPAADARVLCLQAPRAPS